MEPSLVGRPRAVWQLQRWRTAVSEKPAENSSFCPACGFVSLILTVRQLVGWSCFDGTQGAALFFHSSVLRVIRQLDHLLLLRGFLSKTVPYGRSLLNLNGFFSAKILQMHDRGEFQLQ